jgi:hypothetical protein
LGVNLGVNFVPKSSDMVRTPQQFWPLRRTQQLVGQSQRLIRSRNTKGGDAGRKFDDSAQLAITA